MSKARRESLVCRKLHPLFDATLGVDEVADALAEANVNLSSSERNFVYHVCIPQILQVKNSIDYCAIHCFMLVKILRKSCVNNFNQSQFQ